MSGIVSELWANAAFQNALWLFLGIVAGALVQFMLSRMQVRSGANNALRVMKTEIELNLDEYENFKRQIARLKELISAGQVNEGELLITMEGFNYSAVNPLVQQGFFHYMLGAEKAKEYFAFMRFFNNDNANVLTNILRNQHQLSKSIAFLNYIESKGFERREGLSEIMGAKLRRGLLLSYR